MLNEQLNGLRARPARGRAPVASTSYGEGPSSRRAGGGGGGNGLKVAIKARLRFGGPAVGGPSSSSRSAGGGSKRARAEQHRKSSQRAAARVASYREEDDDDEDSEDAAERARERARKAESDLPPAFEEEVGVHPDEVERILGHKDIPGIEVGILLLPLLPGG